jgi:hypothetical protein
MKVFITGFLLLTLCGCAKRPATGAPSDGQTNRVSGTQLAIALKEAEAYYAPLLPRMLDDETRLVSVRATATELQFENVLINTLKSELNSKFVDALRLELEEQARRVEKANSLLQLGASLVYSIKDKRGAHVAVIRVKPDSAAKAPLSPDEALANAKLIYQMYVQGTLNFDPGVAMLYTDSPRISVTQNFPDGTSQTNTVPAGQFKQLIRTAMPLAKERGYTTKFSLETYEQVGADKVKIKTKQYSVAGAYWSDVTLLVVRIGDKWLISEDLTVSTMPKNPEEK